MYDALKGMQVVEASSFVASPSCGLYLSQMGADVIRIDPIGGGPDFGRWPLAPNGKSLYWEALNKGKRSIAIDLSRDAGRRLAIDLITAPGENRGILLTNFPVAGFLSFDALARKRADMIVARVMGRPDGGTAVDYTVNCAIGLPQITGPAALGDEPVNHVLPAWDIATGAYAAFTLMVAERHRRASGLGQEVRVPLSDVAMTTMANLGQVGETMIGGDRSRNGNDLYGAFGRDFLTLDGQRIMIVAITPRQWQALVKCLSVETEVGILERELGASFARDEGLRFEHRERLNPLIANAVKKFSLADLERSFSPAVCWAPYRTLRQALLEDADFGERNPVFSTIEHPSGHSYLAPGAAASLSEMTRLPPRRAAHLGEHTDEILASQLGLTATQIGRLHDNGLVA